MPGDRVGVVGPNGSGKSTLLRILAGEPPDAGSLAVSPGLRVGLLPQELPAIEGTLGQAALAGAAELLTLRARWEALEGYRGTLVLASHDRFLRDRLCTVTWAVEGNTVVFFEGNYTAFRESSGRAGGRS